MKILSKGRKAMLLALLLLCGLVLAGCSASRAPVYQRALDTFAAGDYEAAAKAFDRLGDYQQSAAYAAYSHGMVHYEKGDFAAAEPYFEKTQGFMYGKDRYTYCHAFVLESAGQFTEAAELYLSLGEFENAALAGQYCAARAAEQQKDYEASLYSYAAALDYSDAPLRLEDLQIQVYDYAMGLKKEGQFERALSFFSKLGEYYDSAIQAKECKDFFRRELFAAAEALESEGRLQEAYDAFRGLSGYSDAETRAQILAERLGIPLEEVAE